MVNGYESPEPFELIYEVFGKYIGGLALRLYELHNNRVLVELFLEPCDVNAMRATNMPHGLGITRFNYFDSGLVVLIEVQCSSTGR